MADLQFSNFQNTLIAAKALEVLTARRSPLTIFSNKISEDINASALLVPYASGFIAGRGFAGESSGSGTFTGATVTFGEPYVCPTAVTPNVLTSDFNNLILNIIPAQLEAVMTKIETDFYALVNATTFPTQISSSTATSAMLDSGSVLIRGSGSMAQQYTLVSDKFDTQLKGALGAANIYVQADILKGLYVNQYKCNNSIVLPTSNVSSFSTGADAVTLIPDAIVWASKPVLPANSNSANTVVTDYYGIQFVTFIDQHPVTKKTWVQTSAQVAMAAGRTGFGARLKVN